MSGLENVVAGAQPVADESATQAGVDGSPQGDVSGNAKKTPGIVGLFADNQLFNKPVDNTILINQKNLPLLFIVIILCIICVFMNKYILDKGNVFSAMWLGIMIPLSMLIGAFIIFKNKYGIIAFFIISIICYIIGMLLAAYIMFFKMSSENETDKNEKKNLLAYSDALLVMCLVYCIVMGCIYMMNNKLPGHRIDTNFPHMISILAGLLYLAIYYTNSAQVVPDTQVSKDRMQTIDEVMNHTFGYNWIAVISTFIGLLLLLLLSMIYATRGGNVEMNTCQFYIIFIIILSIIIAISVVLYMRVTNYEEDEDEKKKTTYKFVIWGLIGVLSICILGSGFVLYKNKLCAKTVGNITNV